MIIRDSFCSGSVRVKNIVLLYFGIVAFGELLLLFALILLKNFFIKLSTYFESKSPTAITAIKSGLYQSL